MSFIVVNCINLLLFHWIALQGLVDGVVPEGHASKCSKIFNGAGGKIVSPDYPSEYPDNLGCTWVIKAAQGSRIKVFFEDFQLERGVTCYDKLIVKDGIQKESPTLGTYCGTNAKDLTLTSSGNTLFLLFVADESVGDKGIKIIWSAIARVDMQVPQENIFLDPWKSMSSPKNIIFHDVGLADQTMWAIDSNNDVFYFDGSNWDIQAGKLKMITVGQSGIFGINPTNKSIYWRQGADLANPKGIRWQMVSTNTKGITYLESATGGIIYGLDENKVLHYAFKRSELKWIPVNLETENSRKINKPIQSISCNVFSCWIVVKGGTIYGMTTPWEPRNVKWESDFGIFEHIEVGFGDNTWALNKGILYKKDVVSSARPLGTEWKKQNQTLTSIRAGLGGVIGRQNGNFAFLKDAVCGKILMQNQGTFSSPNFPAKYPPNQSCLWVVLTPNADIIDLDFNHVFDIKDTPSCDDYLITVYPGVTEPIIECGRTVLDKRIGASQVWIEFVSNDRDEGKGFQINYKTTIAASTTPPPTVAPPVTPVPLGWEVFVEDDDFRGNIKYMFSPSLGTIWILTYPGGVYLSASNVVTQVTGRLIKSLAISSSGVWALDMRNLLLKREGITDSKPEGHRWHNIVSNAQYKYIYTGLNGMLLALSETNILYYFQDSGKTFQLLKKGVLSASITKNGIWAVYKNEESIEHTEFLTLRKNKHEDKITFDVTPVRSVKEIVTTNLGAVWGILHNGSVVTRRGISSVIPSGLTWEILPIEAVQLFGGYDSIFLRVADSRILTQKPTILKSTFDWNKLQTNVPLPFKIDSYPKETSLEIWVLGGDDGQTPYHGIYDLSRGNVVNFVLSGDIKLTAISIGESGIWGIDDRGRTRVYVNKDWRVVPNDNFYWSTIESASPLNTVYAIDYTTSLLHFRDGISFSNLTGDEWVSTGIIAAQVSSGPYNTYVVTVDGQLNSFSSSPSKSTLKSWLTSWKISEKVLNNKFSVGFDGSLVYLSDINDPIQRLPMIMKDEEDDSKWKWKTDAFEFTDISAGPVLLGIRDNNIYYKTVSSCFSFIYNQRKESVTVDKQTANHCTWLTSSQKATFMEVDLEDYNIPSRDNCLSSGIVYSSNHKFPLLGNIMTICKKPFKKYFAGSRAFYQYFNKQPTSSDTIELELIAKAEEASSCGGVLTGTQGVIKSQNFPSNYPSNENCVWTITVPAGEHIDVNIETLNIELGSSTCEFDYLQFNDGHSPSSPILGKYCGEKAGLFLTSSTNKMRVLFKSDKSGVKEGFRVRWFVSHGGVNTALPQISTTEKLYTACGGSINKKSGSLASPNYPSNYESNLNCEWLITVDTGSRIKFNVLEVDTEDDDKCLYDFVEVHDGLQSTAKWLARYCGIKESLVVYSTGNSIRVHFRSDASTTGKGFRAEWEVVEKKVVTTTKSTPSLPKDWLEVYQGSNLNLFSSNMGGVVWTIDNNYAVKVTAKAGEQFSAIAPAQRLFYVSLGGRGTWALSYPEKYVCFKKTASATDSNGNAWERIYDELGSKNFKIVAGLFNVYLIKENGRIYIREGIEQDNWIGLKWKLYGEGKDISEGSFGTWLLKSNGNLYFSNLKQDPSLRQINLSSSTKSCSKVVAGFSNVVYIVCGGELYFREGINLKTPEGVTWKSTGVTNVKDVAINNGGVLTLLNNNRVIKKDDVLCGGVLINKRDTITYPEFDSGYKENKYCLWFIDLKEVGTISFIQNRFDLEQSEGCVKDRVTIAPYNLVVPGKVLCDKGFYDPKLIIGSNKIYVEFVSDNEINKRGFSLSYQGLHKTATKTATTQSTTLTTTTPSKACGVTLTNVAGFIASPNYPNKYDNRLHCEYKIRFPKGTKIRLSFLKFDVEFDSQCKYDYLQLYEVDQNNQRVSVKRLCGNKAIPDFESSGNKLDVVFKTDSSTQKSGFSIRYVNSNEIRRTTVPPSANLYPPGWHEITTPEKTFLRLDASVETPTVVAIDLTGTPYLYSSNNPVLQGLDKPSEDMKVSPGRHSIYGVDKYGDLYIRYEVSPTSITGRYWGRLVYNNRALDSIDYGANNEIIAITFEQEVVSRVGMALGNPNGGSWKVLATGYTSVSVGTFGYWLLDHENSVFFARFVPSLNVVGKLNLVPINGKFRKISAGFGGSVWAIDRDNQVFRRLNVNSLNPSGTRWQKIEQLLLLDIAAGYDAVYGIASTGRILRYADTYCGGIYESSSGSIKSPLFPLLYRPSSNCLYVIHTPNYDRLTVTFKTFDIEKTNGCYKDYLLTSLDGKFPSKYAVERDCGAEVSPKVFKDRAWFEFVSDDNVQKAGFIADWNAVKVAATTSVPTIKTTSITSTERTTVSQGSSYYQRCGGSITGTEGVIVHPNYPNKYQNSRDCNYVITVSPDKIIKLTIEKVDIESSQSCKYDYIEIKDNYNNQKKRYCKPGPYNDVISTGRNVVIRFYTDEVGQGSGFKITWKTIELIRTTETTTTVKPSTTVASIATTVTKRECGKIFKSYSGYVYHPSYPQRYKNNVNCSWTIQAPQNYRVLLVFKFFKIEYTTGCRKDAIKVYNGADDNAPLLGKYCGKDLPANIVSSGNSITVEMSTDNGVTNQGFVVLYKRVLGVQMVTTSAPTQSICEFDLSGAGGVITHPGYPGKYLNNRNCIWYITVAQNAKIELKFINFDLEKGASCSYDFLQVRDGGNVNAKSLGKICGDKLPGVLLSTGNKLFLRFQFDDRQTRHGFKIEWKQVGIPVTVKPTEAVVKPCKFYLSGNSGEFTHRNYPNNYLINTNCYWYITVSKDQRIELKFKEFAVEKGPNCNYDYVRVRDGIDYTGSLLGTFCGRNNPQPIISSRNKLYIHFRSDDRNTKAGFKISWKAVSKDAQTKECEYKLTENSGEIKYPASQVNYQVNKNCKWYLATSSDSVIQLSFQSMDIESAVRCIYDSLQVFDVAFNKSIGKYCGTTIPKDVQSTGNKLFLNFISDDRQTRKGFSLRWRSVKKVEVTKKPVVCGGVYSTNGNIVMHSGYPNYYRPNQDCTYTVRAPKNYRIVLYFQRFQVERSSNCQHDYLQISEGVGSSKNSVGKYCGNSRPSTIRSEKGVITLRFVSDGSNQYGGFKATYFFEYIVKTTLKPTTVGSTMTKQECGGVYTASPGTIIHSYLSNKFEPQDCTYTINAPANFRIKFTYERFRKLPPPQTCKDYLTISHGSDSEKRYFGAYCIYNRVSSVITTDKGVLAVRYRSDGYDRGAGFKGIYSFESILEPTTTKSKTKMK